MRPLRISKQTMLPGPLRNLWDVRRAREQWGAFSDATMLKRLMRFYTSE